MAKVYLPGDDTPPGDPQPSALAIGDSWFWYPHGNVLGALVNSSTISTDHSAIRVVGFNGAQLKDYVGAGRYAKWVSFYLGRGFREGFSEFYISGAGNDAVNYGLALKKDCRAIDVPERCIEPEGLETFLKQISSALGTLIHDIRWAYRNDGNASQPIFVHGYDYPVPDGRGFDNGRGWLAPAMDRASVIEDEELRKSIAKILIDRLNDEVLRAYHSPLNKVIHIDSRNTLSTDPKSYTRDWENEMHPTRNGFEEIVARRWLPALMPFGIAS